jgi:hypothetical protein
VSKGSDITAVNTGSGGTYKGGFIGNNSVNNTTFSGNRNETGVSPSIGYDIRIGGPSDNIN